MSLHTTHRPGTFKEIVGQDKAVNSLERVLKDGRAHSFILSGGSGLGKTTLARVAANALCGGKANQSNLVEIDAASATGIDAMREVANRSHYRAIGESAIKVMIVDEAHKLSNSAWTSLLKIIEEPPAHTYWFFCTTEPGKIPRAIQTRCLKYELAPVDELLIYELLVKVTAAEKLKVSEEVLEAIAEGAGNSPRAALVALEQCLYCETAGEARALMRSAGQSKGVIDLCRLLASGRGRNWAAAMKIVNQLEGVEAESVRIVVCNYFQTALLNTKSDDKARELLCLLEPFLGQPYNQSDRLAPLLRSIGLALGLDQ